MSELATFQRDFARAMTRPPGPLGPIAIYRNTSLVGAVDALRDNYPVVRALVGEAMFGAMAVDYATTQPPDSPVLAFYGQGFAAWIAGQPWTADLPYLGDVARLERLHIESLFSPDAPPLSLDDLAEIGPDGWGATVLRLHPALRTHRAGTPAMSIWLAHQSGTPEAIAPAWSPECALFTRPHSTVEARVLDEPGQMFLEAVGRGESIGLAALAAAEHHPAADIGRLFASLVQAGAFAALSERQRIRP